jgi:hypothetical protein
MSNGRALIEPLTPEEETLPLYVSEWWAGGNDGYELIAKGEDERSPFTSDALLLTTDEAIAPARLILRHERARHDHGLRTPAAFSCGGTLGVSELLVRRQSPAPAARC